MNRSFSFVLLVPVFLLFSPSTGTCAGENVGPITMEIVSTGTSRIAETTSRSTDTGPTPSNLSSSVADVSEELTQAALHHEQVTRLTHRSLAREATAAGRSKLTASSLSIPTTNPTPVFQSDKKLAQTFNGLNHYESRNAAAGNQLSGEPPDQGLAVGNGYILEAVNTVLRVYDTRGIPLSGVVALNSFFGYTPEYDRTTGQYGTSIFDPSCYYDAVHNRWIVLAASMDLDPNTGNILGPAHLELAVSATSSPLGTWKTYHIATQNDGTDNTPTHSGCPCLGDYPHMGADSYGLYITTNEYPQSAGNSYNGAQLYVFSLQELANAKDNPTMIYFQNLFIGSGPAHTVWPAISQPGQFSKDSGGTEYFLCSTAVPETGNTTGLSDILGVFALTNTHSIDGSNPSLSLMSMTLNVNTYGIPPASKQKDGDIPLGESLNNGEVLGSIDSGDSRMQQVSYAGGKLWGSLGTALQVNGVERAGVAWYVLSPSTAHGTFKGSVFRQGYLGVNNNSLVYPSLSVLPNKKGVMAFTLVGSNYYPTAAYTYLGLSGAGNIYVAGSGAGPQDGFTEYNAILGSASPRWGDYGAALTDGKQIWFASEFIAQTCTLAEYLVDPTCGLTRTDLANWATRVSSVTP